MAMIDKAYSTELKKSVDLNEADNLYEQGKITSQTAFLCIGSNCDCPMTCANLAKPKHLRKRDPYFRTPGHEHRHSPLCGLFKGIFRDSAPEKEAETDTEQKVHDDLPDVFEIERPLNHDEEHESDPDQKSGKSAYKNSQRGDKKLVPTPHKFQHLGTLVSYYLKLRKKNKQSHRQVTIEGSTLSYGKLFKRANKLKLPIEQPQRPKKYVYHAEISKAIQKQDGEILVYLKANCELSMAGEYLTRTSVSIVIPEHLLHSYRYQRDIVKKIQAMVGSKRNVSHAYIYAAPEIKLLADRHVVNFTVTNLDLVEFSSVKRAWN